jgi:hypothetical protein
LLSGRGQTSQFRHGALFFLLFVCGTTAALVGVMEQADFGTPTLQRHVQRARESSMRNFCDERAPAAEGA